MILPLGDWMANFAGLLLLLLLLLWLPEEEEEEVLDGAEKLDPAAETLMLLIALVGLVIGLGLAAPEWLPVDKALVGEEREEGCWRILKTKVLLATSFRHWGCAT